MSTPQKVLCNMAYVCDDVCIHQKPHEHSSTCDHVHNDCNYPTSACASISLPSLKQKLICSKALTCASVCSHKYPHEYTENCAKIHRDFGNCCSSKCEDPGLIHNNSVPEADVRDGKMVQCDNSESCQEHCEHKEPHLYHEECHEKVCNVHNFGNCEPIKDAVIPDFSSPTVQCENWRDCQNPIPCAHSKPHSQENLCDHGCLNNIGGSKCKPLQTEQALEGTNICASSGKCTADCHHKVPHLSGTSCGVPCITDVGVLGSLCTPFDPLKRHKTAIEHRNDLQRQLADADEHIGKLIIALRDVEREVQETQAELPVIPPEKEPEKDEVQDSMKTLWKDDGFGEGQL